MSLQDAIMTALKAAMKSKDTLALTALRSVKSAILLAQTESGSKGNMSEADEVKLLQKLVKQRRDKPLAQRFQVKFSPNRTVQTWLLQKCQKWKLSVNFYPKCSPKKLLKKRF